MTDVFVCPRHGTEIRNGSQIGCRACAKAYKNAPDAEMMTPEDREREMREVIDGPMTVPFRAIHKRIEQLVGRPVWTHEIGLDWDFLCNEARDRGGRSMGEIVDSLVKTGKPTIVIATDATAPDYRPEMIDE